VDTPWVGDAGRQQCRGEPAIENPPGAGPLGTGNPERFSGEPPVLGPPTVDVSIVAPVHNESRILPEFVARCTRALEQIDLSFELLLVDDASRDDTPARLADLTRDPRVRACRLPSNVGQFRATQAGLREARGRWVAVLDGDLQDPPECLPTLVAVLSAAAPAIVAVLAVKTRRDDPWAFMVGQFVFHRLQHAFSRVPVPRGAGSYCVMRGPLAARVAMAGLRRANLAAVVAVAAHAVGGELATVPYEKGPRYDRRARVGWRGLAAEAVGSLAVTGALPRLLVGVAFVLGVCGYMVDGYPVARSLLFGAAAAVAALSLWVNRYRRCGLAAMLAPVG